MQKLLRHELPAVDFDVYNKIPLLTRQANVPFMFTMLTLCILVSLIVIAWICMHIYSYGYQ